MFHKLGNREKDFLILFSPHGEKYMLNSGN